MSEPNTTEAPQATSPGRKQSLLIVLATALVSALVATIVTIGVVGYGQQAPGATITVNAEDHAALPSTCPDIAAVQKVVLCYQVGHQLTLLVAVTGFNPEKYVQVGVTTDPSTGALRTYMTHLPWNAVKPTVTVFDNNQNKINATWTIIDDVNALLLDRYAGTFMLIYDRPAQATTS